MEKIERTVAEMIEAVMEAQGFLYPAATALGMSTKTLQRRIKEHPTLADAVKEAKYKRDDFVEAQIMKRIREGSDTMVIFYAKTQMKDRGYVERQEISGPDGGPLLVLDGRPKD